LAKEYWQDPMEMRVGPRIAGIRVCLRRHV
jgi:hypothetical protein